MTSLVERYPNRHTLFEAAGRDLEAREPKFTSPPERQDRGGWLTRFADPDGNVLTLLGQMGARGTMRLWRFTAAMLAAVLAAGCASQTASYDYDQSVDFAELRRWAWLPQPREQTSGDPRIDNPLTRQRIEAAVSRELEAKGYERTSPETADFRVGYLVSVDRRLSSSGVSTSIGFGRYGGGSGVGISIGGPSTPIREYDEGTLYIDVRDPESNDLLWRGSSSNRLAPADTPEESERMIERIVGEILANFPPGARS